MLLSFRGRLLSRYQSFTLRSAVGASDQSCSFLCFTVELEEPVAIAYSHLRTP